MDETQDFVAEQILAEEQKLHGQQITSGFIKFCLAAALVIIILGLITISRIY